MALILSIAVSGCSAIGGIVSPTAQFSDAETGQTALLRGLRDKYGMDFQIVGDAKLTNVQALWFTATVAPVDHLDETATAAIKSTGEAKDDYAKNLYKDQIEAPVRQVCDSKPYLTSCATAVYLPLTTRKWDSSTPYDKFVAESGVSNHIIAEPKHEATHDAYADDILDLCETLYAVGIPFQLMVRIGAEIVFTTSWGPEMPRKVDRARIMESLQGVE